MEKLTVWILEELGKRDWKPADLARKAGMSTGTLSNILNGNRGPGPEVLVSMARALGERPEKVFRLAGLLPDEPEPAPDEDKLLDSYRKLSSQERAFLLRLLTGSQGQLSQGPFRKFSEITLPDEVSSDIEEIGELVSQLDILERRLVYDYVRWRVLEQEQRRNSSDRRQKTEEVKQEEVNTAIEHLDLYLAIEAASPEQRQWVIDRLQGILAEQQAQEKSAN